MEKHSPSLGPYSNKSLSAPSGDTLTLIINPINNNLQGEGTMKTPWQVLDELRGESSDDSGGEKDVIGGSGNCRRDKNGVGGGSGDCNNNGIRGRSGAENGNGGDVGGGIPPVTVTVAVAVGGGRMELVESAVVREGVVGKKRKTSIVRDPPTGKPTCPLCRKEFPTWKGAFGHMRAHPDRDYRGFFKPPVFGSPSSTQHHPLTNANKGNTSQCDAGENKSTGEEVNHGEKGSALPPLQVVMFDLNEPQTAMENAAESVTEKSGENGKIFGFDLNAEGNVFGFDLNEMPLAEE
ncbi:hypothetical protein VNO80_09216 [Phaseolus coccineus]|uniref:C2H2-type domain-containing protein n=1 Tax=Phaseolus coccineus TaxID=3886 RepID=A0AAN9NB22_PHACN